MNSAIVGYEFYYAGRLVKFFWSKECYESGRRGVRQKGLLNAGQLCICRRTDLPRLNICCYPDPSLNTNTKKLSRVYHLPLAPSLKGPTSVQQGNVSFDKVAKTIFRHYLSSHMRSLRSSIVSFRWLEQILRTKYRRLQSLAARLGRRGLILQ